MLLVLAQIMVCVPASLIHIIQTNTVFNFIKGIYLLSTVVQMRASFPPPPSVITAFVDSSSMHTTTTMTNLFSTIPAYEVFGSLFDWTFLISAGASLLIKYVLWGVQG